MDEPRPETRPIRRWPQRLVYGTAGAAAAGLPMMAATCNGGCAGCLRCVVGAAGLLCVLVGGGLVRRRDAAGPPPRPASRCSESGEKAER